jgi:hypothetical protein
MAPHSRLANSSLLQIGSAAHHLVWPRRWRRLADTAHTRTRGGIGCGCRHVQGRGHAARAPEHAHHSAQRAECASVSASASSASLSLSPACTRVSSAGGSARASTSVDVETAFPHACMLRMLLHVPETMVLFFLAIVCSKSDCTEAAPAGVSIVSETCHGSAVVGRPILWRARLATVCKSGATDVELQNDDCARTRSCWRSCWACGTR